MIVRRPHYYDEFVCTADRCSFTCCQEWKIGVDKNTKDKWKSMNIPEAACARNEIPETTKLIEIAGVENQVFNTDVSKTDCSGNETGADVVNNYEVCDCIKLLEYRNCPLLNENGLCDVVLTYGEEYISTTCHTFPRENHEFDGFVEKTLAVACPAVLDMLWSEDEFWCVESLEGDSVELENQFISDIDVESDAIEEESGDEYASALTDKELRDFRDVMLELISYDISVEKALKILFYFGLDCLDMEDCYIDEELLPELVSKIDELLADPESTYNEQNELFLDLCDNYRKKGIYKDIIEGLALYAEKYEDENSAELLKDRLEFEQYIAKQVYSVPNLEAGVNNKGRISDDTGKPLEDMLRLLIMEEVYSTMLLPEGDMYSMVMKLQWIAITYVVIKQCLFLRWKAKGLLSYEDIREIVIVVIRMTGYSEADIEEYLENSFEEVIWDWGYMALILG